MLDAWRFDFAIPLSGAETLITYSVNGTETFAFCTPAAEAMPQSLYV